MKAKISLVLAAVLTLAFTGCKSYKKTKSGMPYKIYSSGNGTKVDSGTILKLHFRQMLNDSLLGESFGHLPVYFPFMGQTQPYDFSEVFKELKKGDSMIAIQAVDTLMKKNPMGMPPFMKKGDRIYTTIKILEVFKNPDSAGKDEQSVRKDFLDGEIKVVSDYLAKNKITATKTKSGSFVQIIEPGTGPEIDSGNYVMVKYRGTSFSGKVFDTNMDSSFRHTDPLPFIAGNGGRPGGSIIGLDESLLLLRGGSKAKLFIPSTLAYGGNSGSPDIKPFEHLIFDIEVVSVEEKAPEENDQAIKFPESIPDSAAIKKPKRQ